MIVCFYRNVYILVMSLSLCHAHKEREATTGNRAMENETMIMMWGKKHSLT